MAIDAAFAERLKRICLKLKTGEWRRVYGIGALAMYVTPCASGCGNPVLHWTEISNSVFKCAQCRELEKYKGNKIKEDIASLSKQRRLCDARESITNQFGSTGDYEAALKSIERALVKDGWFQSSAEVLAAAELIRTKTKAQPQVRFGKWRVDYVLPDLKVLLEIDGGFHNDPRKIDKEKIRDAAIVKMAGSGWVVVRVPESVVKTDLKGLLAKIRKKTTKAQ